MSWLYQSWTKLWKMIKNNYVNIILGLALFISFFIMSIMFGISGSIYFMLCVLVSQLAGIETSILRIQHNSDHARLYYELYYSVLNDSVQKDQKESEQTEAIN